MSTINSRQTHCHRLTSLRSPLSTDTTSRSGLTLVEILIALTMTLVVLGAMAQAFSYASREIARGRATLEMSNKLRNAQNLLRTDLAGVTVDVRPYTETTPPGYFEYIDGPVNDSSAVGTANGYLGDTDDVLAFTARNLEGNFRGRVNLVDAGGTMLQDIIQSSYAEIVWFTEETDLNFDGITRDATLNVNFNDTITLYRRVLLIRPNLNDGVFLPLATGEELSSIDLDAGDPAVDAALAAAIQFFVNNDISARWIDTNGNGRRDTIVANSLDDLAKRENRYGRDSRVGNFGGIAMVEPSFYPHVFNRAGVMATKMGNVTLTGSGGTTLAPGDVSYSGDDILLTDVAGFDVKAYSPDAVVDQIDIDANGVNETYVSSSDIGYSGTLPSSTASGDFIDLGTLLKLNFPSRAAWDTNGDGNVTNAEISNLTSSSRFTDTEFVLSGFAEFATQPTVRSGLTYLNPGNGFDVAYCTWSPHYETDGVDQDDSVNNSGLADEGTDGLDNDGANGVDDDLERETAPPYPFPLRGLEVKFRIIEKNSKQLRQSTVVHSFLNQ